MLVFPVISKSKHNQLLEQFPPFLFQRSARASVAEREREQPCLHVKATDLPHFNHGAVHPSHGHTGNSSPLSSVVTQIEDHTYKNGNMSFTAYM